MNLLLRPVLRSPDDEGGSGGTVVSAPAPAPAATAPVAAPAATPAAAPAATPAASPAPAASTPAASPAAAPAPVDGKDGKDGKDGRTYYWPSDWRETIAKADEKILARMQRYASPEAAMGALVAAQNRIASGELAPVLGKSPTPEQLKEFREARGIPETADKYDLGKDITIGDNEKPLMSKLFEAAHGSNQTPEQVKSVVKAWRAIQTEVAEARQVKDEEGKSVVEDSLRTEWGPDFRRNMNLINGLLDGTTDQKLKSALLDARLPDGTKFGNSAEVMQLLVRLALVQNPTGVVVPGGSGDPTAGIREELAKIAKVRNENRGTYNKDTAMQLRERELTNSAIKMKLMDDRGNWIKAA